MPHYGFMVFTPEQYRLIAKNYDSAAADHRLSPAQRSAFAHKADWYRTLGRLGDKPKWAMPSTNIEASMSPKASEKGIDTTISFLSAALRSLLAWQQRR